MTTITLPALALSFIPVALVGLVLWRWSLGTATLAYATARMVIQLLLIGYVLSYLFASRQSLLIICVLVVMLFAASWIALRPLQKRDPRVLGRACAAIGGAGLFTLAIVLVGVLHPRPWFDPRVVVPIAGMIFSNAMNSVSLAAERYHHELEIVGSDPRSARNRALETSLIPMLNAFFAVGLVALPGMMTGQILAGVEPHIAVRYQVLVMCMTFGAAGLAAIAFLALTSASAHGNAPCTVART